MKSKISGGIIAVLFFLSIKMTAQEPANVWFRATLDIPLTDRIKTDIEFQHRRQNDFESENPFGKSLMYNFRTWIYYKQKDAVVFAISPFAYFSNYKTIQKAADANASPTKEYRFTASAEWQHELATKIFIVERTALEYRVFEGTADNVFRLRSRLAFRYDFNGQFNISIGDELFLNATGADANHLFDQNRLLANVSFKPKPALKFDLGYIYISKLPQNTIAVVGESNFYLNVTYEIQKKKHPLM